MRKLPALVFVALMLPSAAAADITTISTRASGQSPAHVQAMADAHTDGIHISLDWERAEPTATGGLNRGYILGELNPWLNAEIEIANIRVVRTPLWARANQGCAGGNSCPLDPDDPAHDVHSLYEFTRDLVELIGPGTASDVREFSFWNEPNLEPNWAGTGGHDDDAEEYSELLARFSNGAAAAVDTPDPTIVAGEIAAGSDGASGNGTEPWSRAFHAVTVAENRRDQFEVFAIHAYSEFPGQIPAKIQNYNALMSAATLIVPTEFGWAVGPENPQTGGDYKCVPTQGAQEVKFRRSIELIDAQTQVDRVVWFNGVDNVPSKNVKCHDTGAYGPPSQDGPGADYPNSYGLYRRDSFSNPTPLHARTIRATFAQFADMWE